MRYFTPSPAPVCFTIQPLANMPAIVLLPSRGLKLWPWQRDWAKADSRDFARNDVDYKGPVLYGRLDVPDALARACRLPGRAVFIWGGPGDLVRQNCPAQPK